MFPRRAIFTGAEVVASVALLAVTQAASAGDISVRVTDSDGDPVPDVAVVARALSGKPAGHEAPGPATMNQRGQAFDPHILVVEQGARIEFPNADNVQHHVYSFSPAKKFDITIASGDVEGPLTFDEAGVVTLGCNIHDSMLGYILVVDSPYFAKTDMHGTARLAELIPGSYEISVWTPRAAAKKLPPPSIIDVESSGAGGVDFRFTTRLYPPHDSDSTSLMGPHY